jgi:hypothetical protein
VPDTKPRTKRTRSRPVPRTGPPATPAAAGHGPGGRLNPRDAASAERSRPTGSWSHGVAPV